MPKSPLFSGRGQQSYRQLPRPSSHNVRIGPGGQEPSRIPVPNDHNRGRMNSYGRDASPRVSPRQPYHHSYYNDYNRCCQYLLMFQTPSTIHTAAAPTRSCSSGVTSTRQMGTRPLSRSLPTQSTAPYIASHRPYRTTVPQPDLFTIESKCTLTL